MLTWVARGGRSDWATSWLSCALLSALAACGTSSGNPVDGDDPPKPPSKDNHQGSGNPTIDEEYGGCERRPADVESVDALTPLGFAASDVLDFAAGTHETTIHWQPSPVASYGPETGEHALQLRVTYAGGAVRYVTHVSKPSDGDEEGTGMPVPAIADIDGATGCEGLALLEVDVEVSVTSDAGALNEHGTATLRAANRNWAELRMALKADELGGAFAITETHPVGLMLVQPELYFGLSPLGLRGEFDGVLEQRSADAVSAAAGGPLALIGDAGSCDGGGLSIELDDALGEVSGQTVIEAVTMLAPRRATWRDGTTTNPIRFTLTHDGRAVCALIDQRGGAGVLRLGGRLQAQSADGRLDADWPVKIEGALGTDGALESVTVSLDHDALGTIAGEDLARVYGVPGLELTGFDGLSVQMELRLTPPALESSASFTFRVNGLKAVDCAKPQPSEPAPPDGEPGASGGGSPGCRGPDVIEVESLTF